MSFNKALIKLLCIPFLCALILMLIASSTTLASTTQQAATSSCPVLRNGSTDADSQGKVTVLQEKLKTDGEGGSLGSHGADGIFGDMTEAAVHKYQSKHNLTADGVVGEDTWKQLKGCDGKSSSTTSKVPSKQVHSAPCVGSIGCGSATFTFTGKNQLTNISMKVTDTFCDSNSVYIELRIYYSGHTKDVRRLQNNGGCNTSIPSTKQLPYTLTETGVANQPFNIDGVRVRVCINKSLASDPCVSNTYAKYIDNPNV